MLLFRVDILCGQLHRFDGPLILPLWSTLEVFRSEWLQRVCYCFKRLR